MESWRMSGKFQRTYSNVAWRMSGKFQRTYNSVAWRMSGKFQRTYSNVAWRISGKFQRTCIAWHDAWVKSSRELTEKHVLPPQVHMNVITCPTPPHPIPPMCTKHHGLLKAVVQLYSANKFEKWVTLEFSLFKRSNANFMDAGSSNGGEASGQDFAFEKGWFLVECFVDALEVAEAPAAGAVSRWCDCLASCSLPFLVLVVS